MVLQGWKTIIFSALVTILPGLVDPINTFVGANPGWSGVIVGTLFAFLRLLTKSPIFKSE